MSLSTIYSKQAVGLSEEVTIDRILRRQAAKTPNAIAIAPTVGKPLTYRGLVDQLDYIAQFLITSGLTHRDCVAIVLPNGPEMAVAFLGVSSGAISAPLNPGYREGEFDFYLSELNAKALIVQSGSDSPAIPVAQKRNIPVIDLSPVTDGIAGLFHLRAEQVKASSVVRRAEPTDVALILHTSGTTSQAKMVPLTHSNLLASARNIATSLGLIADDRCLNVMPLFHIHGLVGALLSSLMAGSSVVCAPGFDGDNFFSWLGTFHPSWYTAVPTVHQAVLSAANARVNVSSHCSLRFIRSSSSALPPPLMRELENVFHVPVIEAYGMTEAAHQICSNPLPPGERKAGSVGVPAGPQVSIMDGDGRLLPSGKVGEVVIRGANVMRGYANDSDGSFTNGWFRTGDQGYLNDDGYLFITGRLKEIINRGGEKISPREIDDIILEHPSIMEAVTFGISHATLGEDVATVVVLRKQVATTELELQQFVASRLADFKVPRQIIIVDAIPKAATGKVQRVGLAGKLGLVDRHEELATPRTVFDTPRTQTENALTRIWSAVLGLDVGLEDNFFHLGGNSIHTAQIISRVRESFGVELSFPTFFEAPAVAAMARAIDGLTATKLAETIRTTVRSGHKFEAPSIVPGPRDANLPLSFAQQRLWFLDQLEPNSAIYNVPSGLRLTGPLDSDVLEQSLNEIIRRHEVLRTIFPNVGGQAVQVILPSLVIPLPLVDVSDRSESDRKHAIRDLGTEESQRPFDLARGPLIRATLLRLNYQDHVLFLTLHHIVFDGWSRGVLFHDLLTLYEALSNGKPSRLEELPIQYADFAVWQRGWLQGEVLEAQLSYWKKQLTSVPPLQLPTDRPRPVVQGYRGTRQSMALSEELTEALKNLSQQESVTLFMTLLAAFQTLLSRYTGQEDIAVGTDMANRNRIETEGLIGFFVNLLVIRTDLSRNPTFRELLRHVRALIVEAYSHQDLPFDKLVEELKPQRDRSRNPLVQVLLVFQNFPVRTQEIRDLTVSPIDVDSKIARFDLVLFTDFKDRQLVTTWNYNTDLFEPSTISRMMNHFKTLLVNIVAQPDARLKELEFVSETERNQDTMKDAERRELKMRSLRTARRKKIEISGSAIVKTDYFKSGGALPLIVQPAIDDVDIVEWVTDNIDVMEKELLKHGAILFRGFGVSSVSQFQEFALAFCPELYGDYGDLPRQSAGARVYESTPYPADQAILFHNESAHMHRWPLKQWFFCAHPPQLRGETPIVDCRRVYDSINPVIRERFAQKQIMYVRNFTNKLDVSWQDFFKTADRSVVENSCRNASIDFEWKKDDTLQTRQVCPAVARHPKTSETVWFNQLQHWHLACLDQATRESLLSIFREQDLPRNCYYGDGSAIEDSVIEEIGDVYRKTAVSFPWQQGDILMVDNMLVAHARNPYVGTRKILVAMGEMVNKEVISYNI